MASLAQQITEHFGGDWHGHYGAFPTPGHSKSDRGMTIRDKTDAPDGVLINTMNGGDPLAVKDECRRLGLLPERQITNGGASWTETGSYDYRDASGNVVYRTVRLEKPGEKKRFVAKRPDGKGGWINGLGDVERVLYRLPDIKKEVGKAALTDKPFPTVYLVEGERKADKLAAWGFLATAVAFGCKGWRKTYAEPLDGCTVVILPDNDDEGRGFAERAAADLRRAGGKPFVVELPGLPPKGDIINWAGSADDLRALVARETAASAPKLLRLINPAGWRGARVPPREWAVDGWVPSHQATYLTGPGSAGKSLVTQQLCTCIALGLPFMGIDTRQAVAIYVTCEDDDDELHRRQVAICEALHVDLASLEGKLHLVSLMGEIGNELIMFDDRDRASEAPRFGEIAATAESVGAQFVALDNVAHLTADEIARNKVAAFVNMLNRLAKRIDGSVLFLGHPNKAGDQFSGSTAWENQVRSRLFLDLARDADNGVPDPDMRVLSRGKANYARNGETLSFRWHQWAFVREEDLPADISAEISANIRANAENEAFLKCLAKAAEERRATSPSASASNYAPKVFASMTLGKGIGAKGFKAAMDRLLHLGTIRNGERVYKRDNRNWVLGLNVVGEGAPTLAPTPAQTDAQGCTDPTENRAPERTNLHAQGRLDTTYQSGAPLGVGAPSEEIDEVRRLLAEPSDDWEGEE